MSCLSAGYVHTFTSKLLTLAINDHPGIVLLPMGCDLLGRVFCVYRHVVQNVPKQDTKETLERNASLDRGYPQYTNSFYDGYDLYINGC